MCVSSISPLKSSQRMVETPRLVLRGAQISDDEDLFECFKDEEAMRYWDTLPHQDLVVTRNWVEKMIQGKNNNGVTDFVICLKPTVDQSHSEHINASVTQDTTDGMKVIGKVGVWQGTEIGFLLNRNYWGQGFALEAVRAVLDLTFCINNSKVPVDVSDLPSDEQHVPEDVVADVDPRNAASLGLLKKFGFEVYAAKEKTFQVGDQWVDSVYLSLKRDTWMKKREDTRPPTSRLW